jgi:CheY-like chemotaxis protein
MQESDFAKLHPPIALVVDDEPLILMDTADMIAEEGFAVVEARTADEAFEFLKRHPTLELLFTDVQTPGDMDGFELARRVIARWPKICVIMASGAARPKAEDLPPGAFFIPKPLSAELVHQVIKSHCEITTAS